MSILVTIFGLLILFLFIAVTVYAIRTKKNWLSEHMNKQYILIGIVVVALFLVLLLFKDDIGSESKNIAMMFSNLKWWGWTLGVAVLVLIIGHKSDALVAYSIVIIIVVGLYALITEVFFEQDEHLNRLSNNNMYSACTKQSDQKQREELWATYLDEVGRDIVICRDLRDMTTIITQFDTKPIISVARQFDNSFGHLLPGRNEAERLSKFITLTRHQNLGNGNVIWIIKPILKMETHKEVAPFYAQDLNFITIHAKIP